MIRLLGGESRSDGARSTPPACPRALTGPLGIWLAAGAVVAGVVFALAVAPLLLSPKAVSSPARDSAPVAVAPDEPPPSTVSRIGTNGDSVAEVVAPSPSEGPPPDVQYGPPLPDPPLPETVAELIKEAEEVANRLVESYPNAPDSLEIKARVNYLLGRFSVSAECWQRALDLNPRYAYAYHGLGLLAAKEGDVEEAAALQRKALALVPNMPDAGHELADALMKSHKPQEAVEVLEDYLQANPSSVIGISVHLGQIYLARQDYGMAKDAFAAALAEAPKVPRAQFGLATALLRLGQKEEAAIAMERFRELRGEERSVLGQVRSQATDFRSRSINFAVRYVYAARLYLAHGDATEAERLLRRAAQLDANNTESRLLLAELYRQTSRREAAIETCRELLEIAPENPQCQQMLDQLEEK